MDNLSGTPPPLPGENSASSNFSRQQQQQQPSAPPARSRGIIGSFLQSCLVAGCATILAPVVIVFGLVVFFLVLAYWSGVNADAFKPHYFAGEPWVRVVREGSPDAGTIALVNIQGEISGSGSPLDGNGLMFQAAEHLRRAREDASVRAVLLQIDSPGGGLTASDLLLNEVRKTRAAGKTVLAWAGGLMASGGYYIAVGAEGIMASPTATVGSIGVIMAHFQVEELLGDLGVKVDPVVSASHKDIGSIFREMTEKEREILQNYVDAAHGRFVGVVAEGRGMKPEDAAKLADGSIYTAEQAKENGLIDRVGYAEDAIAWVEKTVGEKDMRVVAFQRQFSLNDFFEDAARSAARGFVSAKQGMGTGVMAIGGAQ